MSAPALSAHGPEGELHSLCEAAAVVRQLAGDVRKVN
jgi:hypothetical protein